jgi:uncharacterized membrane protein HdeD (DUF308 family)
MPAAEPNRDLNGARIRNWDSFWLGLLTALFAVRVGGQAVQRWIPQPYLPPFGAFQGSRLPYPILLLAQLVILSLMMRACRRAWQGTLRRHARRGRVLGWIGALYMVCSLVRIAIGIMAPSASAWFRAWIPGVFHVVLAAFVSFLAQAYRRPSLPWPGRPTDE